jgi:hypothetical protein
MYVRGDIALVGWLVCVLCISAVVALSRDFLNAFNLLELITLVKGN